jgi:putative ABC transport system permease protein
MKTEFTLFSFALKNLKRKPVRTGILILAIGLLVSVLVFALSFVRRVDLGIKITSDRLGADLLIVPSGSRGAAEDVLLENKVKTFYMDENLVEKIKKVEGIEKVSSQTYLASITGACCDVPETIVVAFDQDSDFIINPWLMNALNRKLQKGEAIVGSESAFNIRIGLTDVDAVLFGNMFHMVGILEKTGTGLDTAIFIDQSNIEDILKNGKADLRPDQISVIFAKVRKGIDPYSVAGKIEDSVIEVDVVARNDIGKGLIEALKDINRIFSVTVILVSILSAFLAWAVFSAIANERSREVGIMRAIGAKETHIVKLFLLEVIVIGSLGSISGILSGTTVSVLLGNNFSILRSLSTDLSIPERLYIAIISFVFGAGICIIGSLSPIRKMKKLEPLVVIKGD